MVRVMTLTVPVINAALKTAIPVLTPLTPILGGGARQGDHRHREDDNSQKAKFEWCVHTLSGWVVHLLYHNHTYLQAKRSPAALHVPEKLCR